VFEVVGEHFPLYSSGKFNQTFWSNCIQSCVCNSTTEILSTVLTSEPFHCLNVSIQLSEEILPAIVETVDHESVPARERGPMLSPLLPSEQPPVDLELQWQDLLAIMEPQVSGKTGRLASSPYLLVACLPQ